MSDETQATGTLFDRVAELEAQVARIWAAFAVVRGTVATPESEDGPVQYDYRVRNPDIDGRAE